MAYEFHYTPTGTGVISGKEVLEQTEDAINDLGNTAISGVQEALDKAEQALTNSENAVDDAQTALNTANNAEGVAIQAQNDVSNLSGTVTNIGNRVTTAEGNISNLQGRMTTAEGNITNLQGRMTTAEGNIGNLQTAVSTAQATANSAQQTATTARQQSYVFRYSSTALVASSTNSNSLLDNTDNLKVGDKVIDSSGVLFSITAIDTANSTFTIGTALIDLAQDSDVVHKSGDETVGGLKTFSDDITLRGTTTPVIKTISNIVQDTSAYNGSVSWVIRDKDNLNNILESSLYKYSAKSIDWQLKLTGIDNGVSNTKGIRFTLDPVNNVANFIPIGNNNTSLGNFSTKWKDVNTYLVNGVEPSSLSLPNPNNSIDISSYITDLTGVGINNYTPLANGYIVITCNYNNVDYIKMSNNLDFVSVIDNTNNQFTSGILGVWQPCIAGIGVQIRIKSSALKTAKFIPCQGNV